MKIAFSTYGLDISWHLYINLTFNKVHSITSIASASLDLPSSEVGSPHKPIPLPQSWFRHDTRVTVLRLPQ